MYVRLLTFFTVDDVYRKLHKLNPRKGCGPDSIPPRLLKSAAHILAAPLLTVFNNSISQGQFPDVWKRADILPLPKCKNPTEAKDYLPIALTSTIPKCMERLLVSELQALMSDKHRFAYQKNKSTEDALILTLETITETSHMPRTMYMESLFISQVLLTPSVQGR